MEEPPWYSKSESLGGQDESQITIIAGVVTVPWVQGCTALK